MGAAEPLRSVLWVKQQRCAVSLDPARALLRWWRSPGPGAGAPGAGECRLRPAGSAGVAGQGGAGEEGAGRPAGGGLRDRRPGDGGRGLGSSWQGGVPGAETPGPG